MKLLFLLAAPLFACQAIDADRILGKDLAAASASFATLKEDVEIGASPIAGVQRVLHPEELAHIAKQNGIALAAPPAGVCFERATAPMSAEQILPVLRQSLNIDGAQIEILDFSRFGVPRGNLEFLKSSLMPNGMWRGRVLYEQNHSMPVWVKTRITVQKTWVEAGETLVVGKPIQESQLVVKTGPRFPFDAPAVESPDVLVGRRPVRTRSAGTAMQMPMLMTPHDVERGDLVAVEVTFGAAVLTFSATAESSGRTGESVMVKNPENGKTFLAKIQTKGHVSVER